MLDGMIEGKTKIELEKEWAEAIDSPTVGAIYERDQWLIPQFQGIQLIKATVTRQIGEVVREATVRDKEQLTGLMDAGAAQRNQFLSHCHGAIIAAPTNVPQVEGSPADQPQLQAPQDVLAKCIMKEVP